MFAWRVHWFLSEIEAGHWFISWYIFTDIISDYFTDSGLESEWFEHFNKSGDFDVEDRHDGGKEKIFEDFELETLLAEDSC